MVNELDAGPEHLRHGIQVGHVDGLDAGASANVQWRS